MTSQEDEEENKRNSLDIFAGRRRDVVDWENESSMYVKPFNMYYTIITLINR